MSAGPLKFPAWVYGRVTPIRCWLICIGGFRQSDWQLTGMRKLWRCLGVHRRPNTCVAIRNWDDNWANTADSIASASAEDGITPTIAIFAYSWGGGWGALNLMHELNDRNLNVKHAVLCDPVYRSRLLPAWLPLNPMSLVSGRKLMIPPNVGVVDWFYQTVNKPAGHTPVALVPERTQVNEGVRLGVKHELMDDHALFQRKSMEVAELCVEHE